MIASLRERFKGKLSIRLPEDISEILINNGIVEVGLANLYEEDLVDLQLGDRHVLWKKSGDEVYKFVKADGKYRWYLVLERLGPIEKKPEGKKEEKEVKK
ncbi:hypothetical protein ES702_00466 [subsurface metagenome]